MTKDEERALFKLFREEGDLTARDALLKSQMGIIVNISNSFNSGRDLIDDLIQEGVLAVLKCLYRFDYNGDNRLSSFVAPTVRGALMDYFNIPRVDMMTMGSRAYTAKSHDKDDEVDILDSIADSHTSNILDKLIVDDGIYKIMLNLENEDPLNLKCFMAAQLGKMRREDLSKEIGIAKSSITWHSNKVKENLIKKLRPKCVEGVV